MDEEFDEIEFLTKDRTRADRRACSKRKARSKAKKSREIYDMDYYDNLHEYSKGKIHCSCNLCRFRPVWDPDNKPIQDVKRLDDMNQQLQTERN